MEDFLTVVLDTEDYYITRITRDKISDIFQIYFAANIVRKRAFAGSLLIILNESKYIIEYDI